MSRTRPFDRGFDDDYVQISPVRRVRKRRKKKQGFDPWDLIDTVIYNGIPVLVLFLIFGVPFLALAIFMATER